MIKTRITEMFGLKYPIISAPMGPFYTTELSVAVSEAGGLGVVSHATLRGKNSVDDMKNQLEYVIEHTDKPFGVNVRTARIQTDHKRMLKKIIEWCNENPKLREQLVYVLTSAGGSRPASKILKGKGPFIKHFHVAPALWLVDKVVAAGCDGIVATGTEGGGHQSYEGITTLVLVQEVARKYPEKPLIACGGFASPEGVAAAFPRPRVPGSGNPAFPPANAHAPRPGGPAFASRPRPGPPGRVALPWPGLPGEPLPRSGGRPGGPGRSSGRPRPRPWRRCGGPVARSPASSR